MSDQQPPRQAPETSPASVQTSRWLVLWENISNLGLAGIAVRIGTHALLITLILLVAWGLREFYLQAQVVEFPGIQAAAEASNIAAGAPAALAQGPVSLPGLEGLAEQPLGITRRARLHTDVPSRSRLVVQAYSVQPGDTLFGLADKFGIRPETLLWANQEVLGDNPHNLRPGQVLNILPVDGTYHRWSVGDSLDGVASFFGVQPDVIVNFSGNDLDPVTLGDWADPNIQPGTWLVIPGGRREFVNWSAPEIPRDNPSVARVLGDGACETVPQGAVGSGTFVWPADNHFLSGFDFSLEANHPGIDIDGEEGDPVYAADSGVVVYAGWNTWGYGNMVVVNHGNGWQTIYAHLSDIYVNCGQSAWQGNVIGAIGSTGNADGSHLHFEMMIEGVKVNPWDYLP